MLIPRRVLLASASVALATGAAELLRPGLSRAAEAPLAPPPPLRPGSRLRLVHAGLWLDPRTDFSLLEQRCAQQGWRLENPSRLRRSWRWFSGTDAERLAELRQAWQDPTLECLIYVGAGWGGARVLEAGFQVPRRSLWTLGFSDPSALLLAQWAAGSAGAVHGSHGGAPQQWQRTVDLLSGRPVQPLRGRVVRPGQARGPLVVTNLTVATHLIGTPWLPDLRGAILVLEDVNEAPYRVDRLLTHWRTAGVLRGVAGVACGRFQWSGPPDPGDVPMAAILEERLGDLGVPLLFDLPVGHGRPNMALPLGRMAHLDGASGQLALEA